MNSRVVIVGAGQGGLQAAESLRSNGFEGEIILCGEERHAPYSRPPLSKGLLLGEMSQEQLVFRKPAVFEKKAIDLRVNYRVTAVDPVAKKLTLANAESLSYDTLVLATGASPRPLPLDGADAKGVHSLRTLDDTLAIQTSMNEAQNVVVVGGGFIGLEMAAVARKLAKTVTVVEFADRLMARVVSPEISAYYLDLHVRHGCNVLLNVGATELHVDETGKITGITLSNGKYLEADVLVLGIGVMPNLSLAEQAGLDCEGGVVTDRSGRTSNSSIYALGDCAVQQIEGGTLLRLESVQNAVEMAKACAAAITGNENPFVAAPWFWSDQYDVKLQMVGLSAGYDQIVLRGSVNDSQFSYFYFKNGDLCAIDSVNRASDHMVGRKLLDKGNTLTPDQAADTEFDLKAALYK